MLAMSACTCVFYFAVYGGNQTNKRKIFIMLVAAILIFLMSLDGVRYWAEFILPMIGAIGLSYIVNALCFEKTAIFNVANIKKKIVKSVGRYNNTSCA